MIERTLVRNSPFSLQQIRRALNLCERAVRTGLIEGDQGMRETFYVTTPIYYVNDVPHIGHAYTTIAADVLNRFQRARGKKTFFLTGVDEHGQKVELAARQRNISPQQHCDQMYLPFQQLWKSLGIEPTFFIRTTSQDHKHVVQKAMQILFDKGLIVKRTYEGWYSTSSERFWMEKDLVEGKDPETGLAVDWISESNYFFLMSTFKDQLVNHIRQHPGFIRPVSRSNEVLAFLERELDDLCISRPKSRLSWGVELPFDPNYVTYVWFDALLNYVSALGYLKEDQSGMKFWPADVQLIGKDILTTHSVYWITMLFALGLEPPQHIFAHGWWTVKGKKMSKSLRNVIDPNTLIQTYGPDIVRYFLLREVPFGQDGDFSHAAIIGRINADLGNDLGNALNRSVAMTQRNFAGKVPQPLAESSGDDRELKQRALDLAGRLEIFLGDGTGPADPENKAMLQFSAALEEIWVFIRSINKYIDSQAPWQLAKENNMERLASVLYNCLEALRFAAVYLAPFMPQKSEQMLEILGIRPTFANDESIVRRELMWSMVRTWGLLPVAAEVKPGEILFPRIEPEHIEPLLRDLLALADNEDQAVELFLQIFPRHKPGKARDMVQKLLTTTPLTATEKPEPDQKKDAHTAQQTEKNDSLPGLDKEIDYATFSRLELRTAEVKSAERVPKSNKLVRLIVNIGAEERQIVAGIGLSYSPEDLIGRKIIIVANLKPTKLMGVESKGMLLAAAENDESIHLCQVDPDTPPGLKVR